MFENPRVKFCFNLRRHVSAGIGMRPSASLPPPFTASPCFLRRPPDSPPSRFNAHLFVSSLLSLLFPSSQHPVSLCVFFFFLPQTTKLQSSWKIHYQYSNGSGPLSPFSFISFSGSAHIFFLSPLYPPRPPFSLPLTTFSKSQTNTSKTTVTE